MASSINRSEATRRTVMMAGGLGVLASAAPVAAAPGPMPSPPKLASAPASDMVDRTFVRLDEGLVHYRSMGEPGAKGGRRPILMCHAGPGSSSSLAGLMPALADNRFVFAPDMLGNGDSAAPSRGDPDIGYYMDATLRLLDKLKIDKVDFYGTHTGAYIGSQMAVEHPDRVARIALDGAATFPAALRAEMLQRYAPEVRPDDWGGHLLWTWNFVRNQSQFFPHYAMDPAHRLANAVNPAAQIQGSVVEVMKALSTYHLAYRAAFSQDISVNLRKITQPTLMLSSARDPLNVYLDEAASLVRGARKVLLPATATPRDRAALLATFFT